MASVPAGSPVNRLSIAQAAPLLGVSPYTVRKWLRQRRLPFHQVGRRIVLDRGDLEAFMRSCRVEARASAATPSRT